MFHQCGVEVDARASFLQNVRVYGNMKDIITNEEFITDLKMPSIFLPPLIQGRFIERPNRFLGRVEVAEGMVEAFVADPGRLEELLYPGAEVYLASSHSKQKGRRTCFDLRS